MTLIVGILCDSGIVVGADGAASLGTASQMTVTQKTKKLSIVNGKAIFAASGFFGIAQRIEAYIAKDHAHMFKQNEGDTKNTMRKEVWEKILKPEFDTAASSISIVGQQAAYGSCMGSYLLAYAAQGKPCLIQFNHTFSPESATPHLPFMAFGSGQQLADPYLALIRRIFWPNRLPTIPEAEFAVWWTLEQSIKSAVGGISDPKQIMVLQKDGADFKPTELSPDECPETDEAVGRFEQYLKKFPIGGDATAEAPPIPAAAPAGAAGAI